MMSNSTTLVEIAQLAENISNDNFTEFGVNLFSIAKKENITYSFNNYGDYFLGALSHNENEFHIFINSELLTDEFCPRARFTFAHELGHYFIGHHKKKLMEGESLTYLPDYTHKLNEPIEREANHFASHLLLPQSKIIAVANNSEPGFPLIFSLKNNFGVSIECTALRYVESSISSCMLIRWNKDFTIRYAPYSTSFSEKTGIIDKVGIRIDKQVLLDKIDHIDISEGFIENAARLSNWISSIVPNSQKDFICLEQVLKLGDYGGLTLLII